MTCRGTRSEQRCQKTLRKLLNDQVRVTERKNLVLSKQFREALEDGAILEQYG
jgi:hypothetical protein